METKWRDTHSLFFDPVVPHLMDLLGGGKLTRPDEAETEPLRVGEIPDTLGELRILHFPRGIRAYARRAKALGTVAQPASATGRVGIRLG